MAAFSFFLNKHQLVYRRGAALFKYYRVLDASTYEKLHRVLVTHLNKSTLFLFGELMDFNKDLVRGSAQQSSSIMDSWAY